MAEERKSVKSQEPPRLTTTNEFRQLLRKQEKTMTSIYNTITNFKKLGQAKMTSLAATNRVQFLKEQLQESKDLDSQLFMAASEEVQENHPYFREDQYNDCVEQYQCSLDYLQGFVTVSASTSVLVSDKTTVTSESLSRARSIAYLPRVDLPKFDGKLHNWEHFRDRFKSLIIMDASLQDADKMHYLTSALTDKASQAISHLSVSAVNFQTAWKILLDEFDDEQRLAETHLRSLLKLPSVNCRVPDSYNVMRNRVVTAIESLRNLNRSPDTCFDLVILLMTEQFDAVTKREWDIERAKTRTFPTLEDILHFLQTYARVGGTTSGVARNDSSKNKPANNQRSPSNLVSHIGVATKGSCIVCKANHLLFRCDAFRTLSIPERIKFIQEHNRCANCFSPKHATPDCTNPNRCQSCGGKHHTLLHLKSNPILNTNANNPNVTSNAGTEASSHLQINVAGINTQVLLPTARIKVYAANGRCVIIRVLIDLGSQVTLLSERVAQLLHLSRASLSTQISGVGHLQMKFNAATCIGIGAVDSTKPFVSANTLITSNLTRYNPDQFVKRPAYPQFAQLPLADIPMSGDPFDALLGSNVCAILLKPGIVQTTVDEPAALNSIFGWLIFGNTQAPVFPFEASVNHITLTPLQKEIQRFWEIENVPEPIGLVDEADPCEQHFKLTHTRLPDGRYVVRLPFKDSNLIPLGESRTKAVKCIDHLRRKLDRNLEKSHSYDKFMSDYENLGHMERISREHSYTGPCHYIPHHGVYKRNGDTQQLRVVFNASSVTASGKSLNDCLLSGPKLQQDLPAIILRWRQFRYVLVSDISKMFRQILIDDRDTDFQRILWRSSSSTEISEYRLKTVTYGTTCAPYLALRVVNQLALDEGHRHPNAVSIIRRQMYVDDFLFGADDVSQLISDRDQLIALLARGGFTLSKWSGNQPELLSDIDSTERKVQFDKELSSVPSVKVLGIEWFPMRDAFGFSVQLSATPPSTKRSILSTIARLYDPLGWIVPVVIKAKILMQRIWLAKSGWDDILPDHLLSEWHLFYSQLPHLKQLSIARWSPTNQTSDEPVIYGFADASESAYAAAVYLRSKDHSGQTTIQLIASKSKVAPLQTISLPRLELCAALLLSRLLEYVRVALSMTDTPCICWSDSTITLAWIRQPASRWKTFVANRVSEIQRLSGRVSWRHIRSEDNPADCASRGIDPADLVHHPLWWSGPSWLKEATKDWPQPTFSAGEDVTNLEEKQHCTVHAIAAIPPWDLQNRFSSWSKLVRVTAYVMRFVKRLRLKTRGSALPSQTFISPKEIQSAKVFWLRRIQFDLFEEELLRLRRGQSVKRSSSLATLTPWLDADSLIRIQGRLSHTEWSQTRKQPIVLKSHPLVRLIVAEEHLRLLHAGPRLTLSSIRLEYWILRARPFVRSVLNQCVPCVRHAARLPDELMGELPRCRVTPGQRAFLHTGIDYAGPLPVRLSSGRGYKSHKAYISVFICMVTKAIHLELVSDLSTQAFLAAFYRFTARRGTPTDIYSDNGTTFRGADTEIANTYNAILSDPTFRNHEINAQVNWHFIPPRAPHFGGLWEAAVRSVKHHLVRSIGLNTLSLEEMMTLLCRIEGCLNSRPIGSTSDSLDDFDVLTPGHFLIGASLTAPPEITVLDVNENRLTRWLLVQKISETFWKAWSNDYLYTLQHRPKWLVRQALAKTGRIVLIRDSGAPPSHWRLGRIIDCNPGQDGLTRVVTVRTATTTLKRPIKALCFLPIDINRLEQGQVMAGGSEEPKTS